MQGRPLGHDLIFSITGLKRLTSGNIFLKGSQGRIRLQALGLRLWALGFGLSA